MEDGALTSRAVPLAWSVILVLKELSELLSSFLFPLLVELCFLFLFLKKIVVSLFCSQKYLFFVPVRLRPPVFVVPGEVRLGRQCTKKETEKMQSGKY